MTNPVVWPDRLALVVFDFDGVMTDNTVLIGRDGEELVRCNRSDGWGIARLSEAGTAMLVLSTERNPVVMARCVKLGLECEHGLEDKASRLREILHQRNIDPAQVAYLGNDENDLGCLDLVGLAVVVADAHPSVLDKADLVLQRKGGEGAVREFCDMARFRLAEGTLKP